LMLFFAQVFHGIIIIIIFFISLIPPPRLIRCDVFGLPPSASFLDLGWLL
jgi:hypothetical protein